MQQLDNQPRGLGRRCSACGLIKNSFEFARRPNAKGEYYLRRQCKPCRKARQAFWHATIGKEPHRLARHAARREERMKAVRAKVMAIKARPCTDCGGCFPPECMDFDHVRGVKRANIGAMLPGMSPQLLEEELLKCEIVCANCHRVRTYRKNPKRYYARAS